MAKASLSLADLDAIAVSKGPGSYTGLRIGVSAAKGLCFSLDVPLISIPTLESLARQLQLNADGVAIALLDARRMEVYSCAFDYRYEVLGETKAEIINTDSFKEYLNFKKVHLIGSGSKKCIDVLTDSAFEFHPTRIPSANEMVKLASLKFEAGLFEDVAYFEPFYLKDFVLKGKQKP